MEYQRIKSDRIKNGCERTRFGHSSFARLYWKQSRGADRWGGAEARRAAFDPCGGHRYRQRSPMREITQPSPPVGVNLLAQARDLHRHSLCSGVKQRDGSNQIQAFECDRGAQAGIFALQTLPTCYQGITPRARYLRAYCHKVCKVGGSSVMTAQGSLTPCGEATTRLQR